MSLRPERGMEDNLLKRIIIIIIINNNIVVVTVKLLYTCCLQSLLFVFFRSENRKTETICFARPSIWQRTPEREIFE